MTQDRLIGRRGLLGGIGLLFAAPAIVRASSLMAISPVPAEPIVYGWIIDLDASSRFVKIEWHKLAQESA